MEGKDNMRLWMNRVLDFLLWLTFCLMLATGFILRVRLPPGSRGGAGLAIWGWSRHDWGDLHTWLGYAVCVMVVLHLALHWRCATTRWKWPVLVGLLAGILGGPGRGMGRGQGAGWQHLYEGYEESRPERRSYCRQRLVFSIIEMSETM